MLTLKNILKQILTENYDYCSTQFDLPLKKSEMKELFKDFFDEGDIVESDCGEVCNRIFIKHKSR